LAERACGISPSGACFPCAERQGQTDCANDDFCGQQLASTPHLSLDENPPLGGGLKYHFIKTDDFNDRTNHNVSISSSDLEAVNLVSAGSGSLTVTSQNFSADPYRPTGFSTAE
jgi:hypothetical protein